MYRSGQLTRAPGHACPCSGCIWMRQMHPLYKNMALWNMIPCMTERNDKDTQFCPASLLPESECVNHLLLFNHLIIIFQLATFLFYYIVLISCITVLRPILIIGDGKYNVKVEKIILSAYFVRSRGYGLRFGLRSGRSRACGLHFDACIYKIIIKTLSVHSAFPIELGYSYSSDE